MQKGQGEGKTTAEQAATSPTEAMPAWATAIDAAVMAALRTDCKERRVRY